MLIKEITDKDVTECTEDTPLADVYELVQKASNKFVVVIDSGLHRVPLGIVNEHSICEGLIKHTGNLKGLDAGNVMNSRIKRVCDDDDAAACRYLLTAGVDAVLVVNRQRGFLGTVEVDDIRESLRQDSKTHRDSVFGAMLGHSIPASVEIPAYGWLK
jgi:predicted transcriptional regulator